jgi:enoyl-CoA hydratase/carnithine racemase
MSDEHPLLVESRPDGVTVVTLNRPERLNALNDELFGAIGDTFEGLALDPSVRVVVVTGAGKAFCAGADLVDAQQGGPPVPDHDGTVEWMRSVAHRGPLALYRLPQPTIAAVNGPAAGGGLGLALNCDLRIAAPTATFSAPFVRIGIGPDCGCSSLLPRIAGSALAMEMLLTGRRVGAAEAVDAGLASRVSYDALAASLELAATIAAMPPEGPPQIKAAVRAATGTDHETVLTEVEPRSQAGGLVHPEFRARASAWLAAAARKPT